MTWNSTLTETQIDKIIELSAPLAGGRRRSPRRIAEMLGVSQGAVSWQMYRNGLKIKGKATSTTPRVRKDGTVVRPYSADEDAFITAQRQSGRSYREIASAVQTEFGHYRRPSSVKVRLIMLAGFEEQAIAA
jgi:hypothetical protein